MKNSTLILLLLTFCLLLPLWAQDAPDASGNSGTQTVPAPPRNIMPMGINHKPNPIAPPAEIAGPIDKFFKSLKSASDANSYAAAYDTFLAGTMLGSQNDKKSVFISKTQEAFGLYGKLNDYEIFDNYSVGSNVLVLTYLSRHDVQPLRWRFIFYRPDKTWSLINMGFDDVLLDMLD
jgi:hypothetical protein